MKNGRSPLRWTGVLVALVIVSVFCIEAWGTDLVQPKAERPDIVTIDDLAALGDLELPEVTFYHDRHTDALAKAGDKLCATCHLVEDNVMSFKFKRLEDKNFEEVKLVYHDNCFTCHADLKAKGEKSGPEDGECRRCHNADPAIASNRVAMGFDNVLHYRHWANKDITFKNEKENCGACHSKLDPASGQMVYKKGEEGSWRFDHGPETVYDEASKTEVLSFADYAHAKCVSCHQDMILKKQDTGPVKCAGCHGPDERAELAAKDEKLVEKMGELPRLKMDQPDAALIMPPSVDENGQPVKRFSMKPVAFNHKVHELENDTCRVCHHQGMQSCASCHTVDGSGEKSGGVTLEQAMHLPQSEQSCVGCHRQEQQKETCAGCHNLMENRLSQESCDSCHVDVPGFETGLPEGWNPTPETKSTLAASMLESRSSYTYTLEEIPEAVKIDDMVNEYKAVEFPHRKIVLKLMDDMKDDTLAVAFHADKGTLCQGCHHNSPASVKPPSCGNCHSKPFDANVPNRPGLKAAFHGQCIGCHQEMGITQLPKGNTKLPANSCVVCHEEKK